ncbi:MAG: bifunctional folylpolyglutamate synthase/dihydrofolate synthase [Bacteroidota bacterium]|nr:bifunctional folylpolyglutamate synthase/dihydrofolate synthase [Bacteroidota bacterium]
MNYQETIEYLFTSLPMFQRIGDAAIKKDLTNIRQLTSMLDNPHERFQTIHIAGTNGKGSTSHMLASIFQASGYKTGLYTSPHYVDFRERIKIDGNMISEKDVINFVANHKNAWHEIQPSFFEITVAMAFDFFRNQNVDIAIIETGLGGRLDSTNIITPRLSVITNISYDHMAMLGNTLPEIAFEKAGIIKKNIPIVIGEWKKETAEVFKKKAANESADITFASRKIFLKKTKTTADIDKYDVNIYGDEGLKKIESDLTGPYQQKNIITVLAAYKVWNKFYPDQTISNASLKAGLKNVKTSTRMIGRWMKMQAHPVVITDAAHNLDGMQQILPALKTYKARRKHFVLGFVSDKDVKKLLGLFPTDASYYWCSPDIPRGKPASDTMKDGESFNLIGVAYKNVGEAFNAAITKASDNDLIFVGGSSYVVGNFLEYYK